MAKEKSLINKWSHLKSEIKRRPILGLKLGLSVEMLHHYYYHTPPTRFAVEVIREVRRQTGDDLAMIIRISQFKPTDFNNKTAQSPQELESWLTPLADAGADILHCSQRRFWEAEYEGSDLNLAGWAKKLTGKPTITVGSVGLSGDFMAAFQGEVSAPSSLDELLRRFDRGDFDLVAVGRPLLADPLWVEKIRQGRNAELKGFSVSQWAELI